MRGSREIRNRHVLLADILFFVLTPLAALALRLDFFDVWESQFSIALAVYTLASVPLKVLIFYHNGLYRRYWRYASVDDAWTIAYAAAICMVSMVALVLIFHPVGTRMGWVLPRSLPILDSVLTLFAAGLVRFSIRDRFQRQVQALRDGREMTRVLIVGAGHAGASLARELQQNPASTLHAVGFVDDDPSKTGLGILGLSVLGHRRELGKLIRQHDVGEVIIAMPTASGKVIREVVDTCVRAGVASRTLPSLHELASGAIELKALRKVSVDDLLRREPVETDLAAVHESIQGRRVLVSGGGGSIGRELCRQLLGFRPAELLVLGHGENSVFETVSELTERLRTMKAAGPADVMPRLVPVVADVRSRRRIDRVMAEARPEVVFHAAAHKHVHLMELHPCEAVTNNIFGTRNLLEAAMAVDVGHFVMISTDKAVRPSSVMGATKRVAEYLVQDAARRTGRNYQTVRFGNVLGSRGSVVLTFQRQIAAGGPVTVTDAGALRYFMTIPESVQLVLQASVLGNGGEVFVLDMGEPIRILDLARDMIRLSGLQEGRDIDIAFTGLRDGEKMFEKLFQDGETYDRSQHEKIFTIANANSLVPADLEAQLDTLHQAVLASDHDAILRQLASLIPDFQPTKNHAGHGEVISDRSSVIGHQ